MVYKQTHSASYILKGDFIDLQVHGDDTLWIGDWVLVPFANRYALLSKVWTQDDLFSCSGYDYWGNFGSLQATVDARQEIIFGNGQPEMSYNDLREGLRLIWDKLNNYAEDSLGNKISGKQEYAKEWAEIKLAYEKLAVTVMRQHGMKGCLE